MAFISLTSSWYFSSALLSYLYSTLITATPSSILLVIFLRFSSSLTLFSIGFTTSSSMSFGLVPGYNITIGNCGACMSGSSALGIVTSVTVLTTMIMRNTTSVN